MVIGVNMKYRDDCKIDDIVKVGSYLTGEDHQGAIVSGKVTMIFERKGLLWYVIDTPDGTRVIKINI